MLRVLFLIDDEDMCRRKMPCMLALDVIILLCEIDFIEANQLCPMPIDKLGPTSKLNIVNEYCTFDNIW